MFWSRETGKRYTIAALEDQDWTTLLWWYKPKHTDHTISLNEENSQSFKNQAVENRKQSSYFRGTSTGDSTTGLQIRKESHKYTDNLFLKSKGTKLFPPGSCLPFSLLTVVVKETTIFWLNLYVVYIKGRTCEKTLKLHAPNTFLYKDKSALTLKSLRLKMTASCSHWRTEWMNWVKPRVQSYLELVCH